MMKYVNYTSMNRMARQWDGSTSLQLPRCYSTTKAQSQPKTKEKWMTVVGLEIHAQIASQSKLFSGASTVFGSPVNTSVSFFDCATPGTLPVLNRKCVEAGVLTALALSCKVNQVSRFDRKHYFYADLPAGYQITQQRQALAVDGELRFQVYTPGIHRKPYSKVSRIKQLQLEQDSGKSLHDDFAKRSLVDLNRAGIPLMELVFEPDLSDGEEAAALVKELIIILQRLGTCSCRMEEGALRVDANISVNRPGEAMGTRTEVKNIGSVRSVAAAVKYEIERQISEIKKGVTINNETRAWNAQSRSTVPMRDKEEKQDYRFMPEPNLPPLHVHVDRGVKNTYGLVDVPVLEKQLPELPEETRARLTDDYGLAPETTITLVNEDVLLRFFNDIMEENSKRDPKLVCNMLVMELLGLVNKNKLQLESCEIKQQHIGELVDLTGSGTVNILTVKKVLEELVSTPGKTPRQIIEEKNWSQITDEQELTNICKDVLAQNPVAVEKYKRGKKKIFNALLGEIATSTQQRANMAAVVEILKKLLKD